VHVCIYSVHYHYTCVRNKPRGEERAWGGQGSERDVLAKTGNTRAANGILVSKHFEWVLGGGVTLLGEGGARAGGEDLLSKTYASNSSSVLPLVSIAGWILTTTCCGNASGVAAELGIHLYKLQIDTGTTWQYEDTHVVV
jgi:hypothetical protein